MNDQYNNQDNNQPKKSKKWIIISLSIVILILLGFLAFNFLIQPRLDNAYQQGVQDGYVQGYSYIVKYQTENQILIYFNETGGTDANYLTDICPYFIGGQQ